jgi:hypothetical protein
MPNTPYAIISPNYSNYNISKYVAWSSDSDLYRLQNQRARLLQKFFHRIQFLVFLGTCGWDKDEGELRGTRKK